MVFNKTGVACFIDKTVWESCPITIPDGKVQKS
jgi:hypothetical protein